jgi:hypothetical protein
MEIPHLCLLTHPICQQDLRGCRTSLERKPTFVFLFLTILHLLVGILVLSCGTLSESWERRYDDLCGLSDEHPKGEATVEFDLGKVVSGRFFLYYELEGFQHNHFRFSGSFSEAQMLGRYEERPAECSALNMANDHPIFPCGLLPYYFFTDSYDHDSENESFEETGIAWNGEIGNLFKEPNEQYPREWRYLLRLSPEFEGETLNEHFIVWMRITKDSHFRKLWAKAKVEELGPKLTFDINCDYSYKIFRGPRKLVLVKVGGLGGKNMFITIVNFALFALCGIFTLAFKFMCCTCGSDRDRALTLGEEIVKADGLAHDSKVVPV